jgi:hypothetical protein
LKDQNVTVNVVEELATTVEEAGADAVKPTPGVTVIPVISA